MHWSLDRKEHVGLHYTHQSANRAPSQNKPMNENRGTINYLQEGCSVYACVCQCLLLTWSFQEVILKAQAWENLQTLLTQSRFIKWMYFDLLLLLLQRLYLLHASADVGRRWFFDGLWSLWRKQEVSMSLNLWNPRSIRSTWPLPNHTPLSRRPTSFQQLFLSLQNRYDYIHGKIHHLYWLLVFASWAGKQVKALVCNKKNIKDDFTWFHGTKHAPDSDTTSLMYEVNSHTQQSWVQICAPGPGWQDNHTLK